MGINFSGYLNEGAEWEKVGQVASVLLSRKRISPAVRSMRATDDRIAIKKEKKIAFVPKPYRPHNW